MHLGHIVNGIAFVGLCYAVVALAKHWARVRLVARRSLDLAVLNLKGRNFHEAEKAYFDDLRGLLQSGYQKYKHGFYQLFTPTGYLAIASADYVKEMNGLPEGTLDFHSASQKRMIGNYTWLQIADDLLSQTIRTDLTRQLGNLLPAISEEIEYCIRTEITHHKEWTPLSIQAIAPKLIAIVMGRILVGPGLNREEEWVNCVTQFVSDVYIGGVKLKGFNHFTRPFAARFLIPEIRRVWGHQAMARRKLVPILKSRLKGKPSDQQNLDVVQWLLDNNQKLPQPKTLEQLADLALVAYVGSTNTTATTLTNLLLDIAARPSDLDVLREEISRTESSDNVILAKQKFSISYTSKLDSYMKESQRLNPAHLMTFSRIVRKKFTLSNGLTIPVETHLMVPASMISLDDELYAPSKDFQCFRFSDARAEKSEDKLKHQFTTTSPQAMHFGYGRNACPGRFFASVVIKAFTASFLVNFDLKTITDRPENRAFGSRNSPPRDAAILLKARS